MIPFSGLSRFSGHLGGDGPSPLNWDTTVMGTFVWGLFVSFYKAWKSKINLTPCEPHCGHWVRNLGGFKGLSNPN